MQIRDLIPWANNKGSEIAKRDKENPVFSLQRDVNRIFEGVVTVTACWDPLR